MLRRTFQSKDFEDLEVHLDQGQPCYGGISGIRSSMKIAAYEFRLLRCFPTQAAPRESSSKANLRLVPLPN